MTLPDQTLASQLVLGNYFFPDTLAPSVIIDYEMGGTGLNNPQDGLMVKPWWARIKVDGIKEISTVFIGAEDVPEAPFFTGSEFTEISLAFDQNMNPFFAYVEDGIAKFYWYDTAIANYRVTVLPEGSKSPKCCLDDKRRRQTGTSDIIIAYVLNDSLYFRQQRDRFNIQYLLKERVWGFDLLKVGMTDVNRVKFTFGKQVYPDKVTNYRITPEARPRVTPDGRRRRLVRQSYG